MTPACQPDHSVGTWHPRGRRLGPVRYEQRINGKVTGLFFVVARRRYWLIRVLTLASKIPVVGRVARRVLRRIAVCYQYTWLHSCARGEA